jgi:uncharacterized protein YyaL (SSP411 family)
MNKKLLDSVENCFLWLEKQMFTFNRASWGIYERIRIDENERVCLSRPDTASEALKAIYYYKEATKSNRYDDVYENLVKWLEFAIHKDCKIAGSFSFAFVDGNKRYKCDHSLYQNDNGKIIINLLDLYEKTGDDRLKDLVKRTAEFWLSIQREDGTYHKEGIELLQIFPKAPCFVLWMMAAMYKCYQVFKDEKYLQSGRKAFGYIKSIVKGDRLLTAFETEGTENWRPVSSENAIAIYCLAQAYQCDKNPEILSVLKIICAFVDRLIDEKTGAVVNCTADSISASENNSEEICDLVYTESFALNAFIKMYEVFNDDDYLKKAKKLATWLSDIQCKHENPLWDGGWRGSYNIKHERWEGRCNQNNLIDEGGMYSVYTGWTALPIVFGMLKILKK